MLTEINGDLTKVDTKYIAHQCNCLSRHASGLAKTLFRVFPWCNIYSERVRAEHPDFHPDCPGAISIHGNGKDKRYIINMLSQFWPGKPKYPRDKMDGYKAREEYFKSCLKEIMQIEDLESIAFPVKIGCGVAGGNWKKYKKLVETFAKAREDAEVVLVNFKG